MLYSQLVELGLARLEGGTGLLKLRARAGEFIGQCRRGAERRSD